MCNTNLDNGSSWLLQNSLFYFLLSTPTYHVLEQMEISEARTSYLFFKIQIQLDP